MNCKVCGVELCQEQYSKKQWQYKKDMFRQQGYVYCSVSCSHQIMQKVRSETMSKTNKSYASERMKNNNPTLRPDVRAKISEKRKGRSPSLRYGNGSGLTEPQKKMIEALSDYLPVAEYPIPTHKSKSSGYPQCYKPDIAIPKLMIAIEIDGASHHLHSRKAEDKKKDTLLAELGWRVLRFWNKEVNQNLDACIETISRLIEGGDCSELKALSS
ncbi:MAG: endonuclease domain-containing protein [Clostridia bacterium]|nr:endonuclease domain-containing protein [Clostridia bacterium]